MMLNWENRSTITANLLNPAFCGSIIQRVIYSYNKDGNNINKIFPYPLLYIILPILLHKETLDLMPRRSDKHLYNWINENEYLFINFASRTKELLPYTKESTMFLLNQSLIQINEDGDILAKKPLNIINKTDQYIYTQTIHNKARLLGKWLRKSGDVQTIYTFFKIRP